MRPNDLRAASGARRRLRVGRGIGSGAGKTCGRGHKGQKSRSGGFHKLGFEGGQMPLQRRVPKSGFHSRRSRFNHELRLADLARLEGELVTLETLRAAGLVARRARRVKIIDGGDLQLPRVVRGLAVSAAARVRLEAAGGRLEAPAE